MVAVKNVRVEGVEMYEFTHGKKPRGEGNWMFEINGEVYAPRTMTFSKAVTCAKKKAAREGAYSVRVMT